MQKLVSADSLQDAWNVIRRSIQTSRVGQRLTKWVRIQKFLSKRFLAVANISAFSSNNKVWIWIVEAIINTCPTILYLVSQPGTSSEA
jgi:hypothetical protein